MKKTSICLIIAMIMNLFGSLCISSAQEITGPDLADVAAGGYGAHFILQDNEEGSKAYIRSWNVSTPVGAGSPSQLGAGVYQQDFTGTTSVNSWFSNLPSNNLDMTPYRYFSFWYKGDGTAAALNLEFQRSAGNKKILSFQPPTLAEGDDSWHFYSMEIDSARLPEFEDPEANPLSTLNKVFLTVDAGCVIQIDNLLLTEKDPTGEAEPSESSGPDKTPSVPTDDPTQKPTNKPTNEPTDDPPQPPTTEPGAAPDMEAIKKGAYLLDDNEGGANAFIDWRGDDKAFETNRNEAGPGADERLETSVRKLRGITASYVRNYLKSGEGSTSGGTTVNYSQYKYFSFWYKGDGTSNELTLALKDAKGGNVASVKLNVKTDQTWHFVSYPLAELGATSSNLSAVAGFNISMSAAGKTVYVDNLMLSALNPMDPTGTEPSDKPTTPPTTEPEDAPDMEAIKKGAYLLDDNEDGGEAFIDWRTSAGKFEAYRADVESGADPRLGKRSRKLEYKTENRTHNYFKYGSVSAGSPANFSQYNYLSFWYKGDGKANQLTLSFVSTGNQTSMIAEISTAAGDTGWKFASIKLSDIMQSGQNRNSVERMTTTMQLSGVIYVDNMMLSALNPMDPTEIEPSGDPSTPPTTEPGDVPDMEAIKKGAYLLDDNEDGGEAFIDWRTSAGKFEAYRADVESGADSRLGKRSRKLEYKTENRTHNYFKYGSVSAGSPADFSDYNYLSFWYKGDGKANKLTLSFVSTGNHTSMIAEISTASGDTGWKFASIKLSDIMEAGQTRNSVERLTTTMQSAGVIYVDNMMLSALNPMDPAGTEPSDKPTTPPTTEPGDPPDMEAIMKGAYLLDDNEGGANAFIDWRGDSKAFETSRNDADAGADERLGASVRKLRSITASYVRNFLQVGGVNTSGGATVDLSNYQYLSFWYKGDGTSNEMTLAFKDKGEQNVAVVKQKIGTDQDWHFVSYPLSELGATQSSLSAVKGFNISMSAAGKTVYVDNLMFSELNPMDPTGSGPSTSPTPGPGTTDPPDMEEIKKSPYLLDDNEDGGEAFIDWRPVSGFDAYRADNGAGTDVRLGKRSRRLEYKTVDHNQNYFKYGDVTSGSAADFSEYKYFSFWYRGDGKENNLTLSFVNNNNKSSASPKITIAAGDTGWHFVSFQLSEILTEGESYAGIVRLTPTIANVGAIFVDNLMMSVRNPMDPTEEPTDPTPAPTEPPVYPMDEDELALEGYVERESSFKDTYFQYREDGGGAVSERPKFFIWSTAGKNGAPEVRPGSQGEHFIKVMRRTEDDRSNNNQSVWYKQDKKGIAVKPGHSYRFSIYLYVEGTGTTGAKMAFKFTKAPAGANTTTIAFGETASVKRGAWQKLTASYYVPAGPTDDLNDTYYLMFAPYINDCDEAGTRDTVFYLDDFSAKEILPALTLAGPGKISAGDTTSYAIDDIRDQWGGRFTPQGTVVKYELLPLSGMIPNGVAISEEGVLTVPEDAVSFRAKVRAAVVDQSFAQQPLSSVDPRTIQAYRDITVQASGGDPGGENMISARPEDFANAPEISGGTDGAPAAFDGDTLFLSEDGMGLYNGDLKAAEGVPYRAGCFVYVPGTGKVNMRFDVNEGDLYTDSVEIDKGRWVQVCGNFVLPVSNAGAQVEKTITLAPIMEGTGSFYFDQFTLYRIVPKLMPAVAGIIEEGTYDLQAQVLDQWGYPAELPVKYQLAAGQGTLSGIQVSPEGVLTVSQGAQTAQFTFYAGITYADVDLSNEEALHVLALEKQALSFYRQTVVDDLLNKAASSTSKEALHTLIWESKTENVENADILGLNKTGFYALSASSQAEVMEILFERKGEITTKAQTAQLFDTLVKTQAVVDQIKKADAAQIGGILEENKTLLGIDPQADPYYPKYHGEIDKALVKDVQGISRVTEFAELFRKTSVYSGFNAIPDNDKGAMDQFLKNQRTTLSIDSRYFDRTDKQVAILQKLCNTTVAGYTELTHAINKVIDDILSSTGGGTGGGGGGGGGGSGIKNPPDFMMPVVPSTVQEPETEPELPFADLKDAPWAQESILALLGKGVVQGVGNGRFEPARSITREEFIKILICSFEIPLTGAQSSFGDLDPAAWYYPYVAEAEQLGFVNGMGDGSFGLQQPVTRQDMAAMIYRLAQYSNLELPPGTLTFEDQDQIGEYAREGVAALSAAGVINGMGENRFEPALEASRAMACKVIYELLNRKG